MEIPVANKVNVKWQRAFQALTDTELQTTYRFKQKDEPLAQLDIQVLLVEEAWADGVNGPWAFSDIEWLEVSGPDSRQFIDELREVLELSVTDDNEWFRLKAL